MKNKYCGAAAAKNVISLNDLIDKYAPRWKEVLEKDDYVRKVVTMPDGNIYSLPFGFGKGKHRRLLIT